MTQFIYAGIGSRETPAHVLEHMQDIGTQLATRGWTLRSGHAAGADIAFELAAHAMNGLSEIYLPWGGFNNGQHLVNSCINTQILPNWETAAALAANLHPAWDKCLRGARALHTRNIYQIIGLDLSTPANCVVCWTKDGKATGGTGQALRLAEYLEIPIFNLFNAGSLDHLSEFIYETELSAASAKQ